MGIMEIISEKNFLILQQVINNPGTIVFKISRKLGKDASGVSLILKSFNEMGLIRKEEKGRRKKIFHTPKGLELYENLKIIRGKWRY